MTSTETEIARLSREITEWERQTHRVPGSSVAWQILAAYKKIAYHALPNESVRALQLNQNVEMGEPDAPPHYTLGLQAVVGELFDAAITVALRDEAEVFFEGL